MAKGKGKSRGVKALAWISIVLAAAGGAAATPTPIGTFIGWLVNLPPVWFAPSLLFVLAVITVLDPALDGVPNWLAVASVIVMPSVAKSVDGKLGTAVTNLSNEVLAATNEMLGDWLPQSVPALVAAIVLIASAALMARRVVRKMPGGAIA